MLRAAPRVARVKHAQGGQVTAAQSRYFIGFIHCLQHRKRSTTADVRGQRQQHAGPVGAVEIEQSAAQEQVGGSADGRRRAAVGHVGAVAVVEPDAVAVHGARAQQADPVVDVEVAARLREQALDPGALVLVLRHVGLHEGVRVGARQLVGQAQLFVAGGVRSAA